jgi:hypothetical protein
MLTILRPRDYVGAAMLAGLWALPTLGHFGRELGVDQAFALITAPILTISLALLLRQIASTRHRSAS